MSFASPVVDSAAWQWNSAALLIPDGLRYAGVHTRALFGGHASEEEIRAPCNSAIRHISVPATATDPGFEVLQLMPLAHRFRALSQAIEQGLPTFYFFLPLGTVPAVVDEQLVRIDEVLATTDQMLFATIYSDRISREPVLCADILLSAINATPGGLDASAWQAFRDAVHAATNSGADAPVLLMDHAGQPLQSGLFDVAVDGANQSVSLAAEDGGDLQAAIARAHAEDPLEVTVPDLWGRGAGGATLSSGGDSVQFARVEDGVASAGSVTITPSTRHILNTNLDDWFAQQFAVPSGAAVPSLNQFTRGNRVVPLVNGVETFADIFGELDRAGNSVNGAFHLVGWAMFADAELTSRPEGAADDYPITLAQVAERLQALGGSRYVAVDFITVSDPDALTSIEVIVVFLLVAGQLFSAAMGPRDGSGMLLGLAVLFANAAIIEWLRSEDFQQLEPNRDAVETLDAIPNTSAVLSSAPNTIDDNPLANIDGILHGTSEPVFEGIRHFSVFHQKMSVVRVGGEFIGHCGGIDFNPNRLDDDRHLKLSPYHDVHARIEGPAVSDLVETIDERLQREGAASSFTPADTGALPDAGEDIVQVARTYSTATDATRQLSFAPAGDRTLLDTTLQAISQAKEYIYIEDQYLTPPREFLDALVERIESGELKKVIILIPVIGDQPFGDARKTEVIEALRAAAVLAGDPNIVRVGSPRRHFTTPTSDLRSSSGRVTLKIDIISELSGTSILALGPPHRLPPVPFWVSINGELIWVYDESPLTPNPDPENMAFFQVARGDETRVLSGVGSGKGSHVRQHKAGSAATLVNLDGIYVHAKMMLIDDVFLSIGSANLNRRGFYSDGECNVYSMPAGMKASSANPVRRLRKRLWAEMLDIPLSMVDPLLDNPADGAKLFDRSYFLGNRFVRSEAFPKQLMLRNFSGGDGLLFSLLGYLGLAMIGGSEVPIFNTVVDPSSDLDPDT